MPRPEFYSQALEQFTAASKEWTRHLDPEIHACVVTPRALRAPFVSCCLHVNLAEALLLLGHRNRVLAELKIVGSMDSKQRADSSAHGVLHAFALWTECDPCVAKLAFLSTCECPVPPRCVPAPILVSAR